MTREDVTKLFPDATDAQVTALLNANNSEVAAEKKNAEDWKAKAGQAKTLEQQLSERDAIIVSLKKEIENGKQPEESPLEKEVKELKVQLATERITNYAASNGLSGENFNKVLSAFNGNIDLAKAAIDGIVSLKNEWESGAAHAKEQELAASSMNPGGSGANAGGKDIGMELAKSLAPKNVALNTDSLSRYRR